MNKKDWIYTLTLTITICVLLILNIGNSFAYFGTEENKITSTFDGYKIIEEDTTISSGSYTVEEGEKNVILATAGTSTITSPTINKSGNGVGEEDSIYGTNSAILVKDNASVTITGGYIHTNGTYANGVFSSNNGKVNTENLMIQTENDNSYGYVTTEGGTIHTNNSSVYTLATSSPAIKSGPNGGEITINGGTFTTNGANSPVVYSSGNITIENAKLSSKLSDNIYLYQSSNDTTTSSTFKATSTTFNTQNGNTFSIANTKASIVLKNNTFSNQIGDFLKVSSSSSKKGEVDLVLDTQEIKGNITVDDLSSLIMSLTNNSSFEGSINSGNQSDSISLSLSEDSQLKLTSDTYINNLEDEDTTYSNIDTNGYNLYIDGKIFTKTSSNPNQGSDNTSNNQDANNTSTTNSNNQDTNNAPTTDTNNQNSNNKNETNNKNSNKEKSESNSQKDTITNSKKTEEKSNQKNTNNQNEKNNNQDKNQETDTNTASNKEDKITTGKLITSKNSSNKELIDNKTLNIINITGIILIITSIIGLIKNHNEKKNIS